MNPGQSAALQIRLRQAADGGGPPLGKRRDGDHGVGVGPGSAVEPALDADLGAGQPDSVRGPAITTT